MHFRELVAPVGALVLGTAVLLFSGVVLAEVVEGGSAVPGLLLALLGLGLVALGTRGARRAAVARRSKQAPPRA